MPVRTKRKEGKCGKENRNGEQRYRACPNSGSAKRRQWLAKTGFLLGLALILASCSGGEDNSTQDEPLSGGSPGRGKVYYYVGPNGNDSNNGRTPSQPLATFDMAVKKLKPGNTLVILDGTYSTTNGNNFFVKCGDNARSGTKDAPITVHAEEERQAWIKSNGAVAPFKINNCSYWDVSGLRLSSADYKDGASNIFKIYKSDHIRVRRLLLHHANRWENSSAIGITESHHVLVEETEVYFFHRHGISAYKSDHIILRRDFVHARNATDLEEPGPGPSHGRESHGCCTNGGDEAYSLYFTSNSIVENCISVQSEHFSIIGGVATVLGNPGGQNNQLLGNISYKDLRPGFLQSRRFDDSSRPYTGPSKDIVIKDFLVVGGQQIDKGAPFSPIVAQNMTIDRATWYHSKQTAIYANPVTRTLSDRAFLGCDSIGGCDYHIQNVLMLDNSAKNLIYAPQKQQLHFRMEFSNAWPQKLDEESLKDRKGQFRHSMHKKPTRMGLDQNQCMVFAPKGSNMSRAGKNGATIGANILYRYKNGKLTSNPLWDPQTGKFPHGAVIRGSVNDPAKHKITAASISKLLNVNTNGCQLPY